MQISRALIFDSVFDPYKGVLAYVKVVDGSFKAGEQVHLIHSQTSFVPTEVGYFTPEYQADKTLSEGQIWYITTGQKSVRDVKIGDTILWGDFRRLNQKIPEDSNSKATGNWLGKEEKEKMSKITYDIIWACMAVHREFWGWLREEVYKRAVKLQLIKKWYSVIEEAKISIRYEDNKIWNGFIDLLINDEIVVEFKSKGFFNKNDFKQIRTYLQFWDKQIGLLVDFGWNSLTYKRLEKDYIKEKTWNQQNSPIQSPLQSSEIFRQNLLKSYLIPGFKKVTPYVYAGVYPIDSTEYDKLKDSLEKLSLNDSAVEYEMEDSGSLGLGFRCGFLGMLHMDIIKERLRREYKLDTIFTIPTVMYLIKSKNLTIPAIKTGNNIKNLISTGLYETVLKQEGITLTSEQKFRIEASQGISSELNFIIDSPDKGRGSEAEEGFVRELLKPRVVVKSGSEMIEQGMIEKIREPVAEVEIVWPKEYAGNIMALAQEYRGNLKSMEYLDETRVVRHYLLPMGEIIIDFYDRLKSATKGYATMNYDFKGYESADLVKLDIFINNEKVEALTRVVHRDKAYSLGRDAVEKLKTLIPRQLFPIPIQAGLGTKMIARETISAMKKDVLAKCYGGDVSRKRKLLQKQKEGKKRMKAIGNVEVPTSVFIDMISRG